MEQFELYQELKLKLGTPEDFQQIGSKKHPKKSFVRKVQRFFNVSCELVEINPFRDEQGQVIAWLAKARAVHLGTGAFQEGDGACSYEEKTADDPVKEKRLRTIHNVRSHAVTRAKNRAILDLVGFGDTHLICRIRVSFISCSSTNVSSTPDISSTYMSYLTM